MSLWICSVSCFFSYLTLTFWFSSEALVKFRMDNESLQGHRGVRGRIPFCFPWCCVVKAESFIMTPGGAQNKQSEFAYHLRFAWELWCPYPPTLSLSFCVPHERQSSVRPFFKWAFAMFAFVLGTEAETNKQTRTQSYQKMTSAATAAGCGSEGREERERREKGRRRGERERGRTIDQKRHGKERWPDCSAGQEHGEGSSRKSCPPQPPSLARTAFGGSLCGLPLPSKPLLPSPSFPPPSSLLPCTAACHGSLHRNKMISSHLLMNTGHHGTPSEAGPFVLDRDHWYEGGGGADAEGVNIVLCFYCTAK